MYLFMHTRNIPRRTRQLHELRKYEYSTVLIVEVEEKGKILYRGSKTPSRQYKLSCMNEKL
jgi:hypothetical protein